MPEGCLIPLTIEEAKLREEKKVTPVACCNSHSLMKAKDCNIGYGAPNSGAIGQMISQKAYR
jgi:hypothetical protein